MTLRRAALAIFLASTLAVGAPRDARADTPEDRRAEQLFSDGQAAFESGDFRRAAASFEAAYEAKHHPAVLWNAARSWQKAGEELRAATDFDRYLRGTAADAPHRDEATKTLAEIIKVVGRVQVRAVGVKNVMIDGEASSEPIRFVAAGEHVATAEDDEGRPVRKVFAARAGEIVSVVLSSSSEAKPPPRKPSSSRPEAAEHDGAPRTGKPLSPWVVVGGSVLVLAGGVTSTFSGIETLNKAAAFDSEPTQSRLDDGFESQARTNVALGVTGGLAVLTLVAALFLVDWGGAAPASAGAARR